MLDKFFALCGGCETTGPNTYKGELGALLKDAQKKTPSKMPIVDFVPLPGMEEDVDPELITRLRGDQKYLLQISTAISKGKAGFEGTNLALMHPGDVCQSRWLTKAGWFLRIYASTKNPPEKGNRH